MILCDYGCGREAEHQLKNGKWCCSKSRNSCPMVRNKRSIRMKKIHKDPNSIFNSKVYKEKQEKIRRDPNSIFNSKIYKEKISSGLRKSHKDPNSGFNSKLYKENQRKRMKEMWANPNSNLNSISCKEKISKTMKKIYKDPNSTFNSIVYRNKLKLTIKRIRKNHPIFSKIEEIRYNPIKPEEKEIQVHCKNHECENSKEKGGWFTPIGQQISHRIQAIENPMGVGESNFYCSEECKNTCSLYNLKSDPYKDITKPYTYQENQLWRQIVLKLDKGLCQYCGNPATDVHHIKPVKTHPHLALDPDNGISFCEECHYKIGHKTGSECSTGNLANKQQQGCVLGGQIK